MTVVPQFSPQWSRLPASLALSLALAGNLFAQRPVRLAQETPFLKEPGGVRLGVLSAGTRLVPGRSAASHVEVTVQGWIFTSSTRADRREGFDLSVSEAAGENIRTEPDGDVVARAVNGVLFTRVGRRGGWTQVRRSGWIARSALPAERPTAAASAPPATKPAAPPTQPPAPAPASAAPAPGSETAAAVPAESMRVLLRAGAALSRAPDGLTLGTLRAAAPASVTGRNGDWVQVQVEAWVKRAEIDGPLSPPPAITAAMLRESPERHVGQRVDWRVQFLAHQQADELRPEMPHGARYLLARGPLPESGFVYVMVSRQQAEELQGLKALDEVAVTVTVRAARTRYLATPVVELVRVNLGK